MPSREKAWYYWWNPELAKWYILAFVNGLGSCSMRRWQAADGKAVKPIIYRQNADFQGAFSDYLNGTSSLRLSQSWKGNIVDWGKELPADALCEIRKQVKEWLDRLWTSIS